MNRSAERSWRSSSCATRRTRTLVSTARMASPGVPSQALLQIGQRAARRPAIGKGGPMQVVRRGLPTAADDDLAIGLVPLQHRAGAYAQAPANLDRHRDLPLGGHFRFGD